MASCIARGISQESHLDGYVSSDDETSDDEMPEDNKDLSPALRAVTLGNYQGCLEVEVFENEEGMDIDKKMAECPKNPGHDRFIHVNKFTKGELPETHRFRELVRAIKTSAELTVRIFTNYVSNKRPGTYPEKPDTEYPWCERRGEYFPRLGTGWIWKVEKYGDGSQHKNSLCQCNDECINLPDSQKKKIWWEIIVMTATHLVFDEYECKHTWIDLWDGIDEKFEKVRIRASAMGDSSHEADRGMFKCVTHNEELGRRLLKFCRRREEKIENCNTLFASPNFQGLTVVISHPHGDKKRISIGYGRDREDEELASYYHYDTPTCHGSSGGFVWAVGWGSPHGCVAPHSWGGNNNSNKSGSSWPLA